MDDVVHVVLKIDTSWAFLETYRACSAVRRGGMTHNTAVSEVVPAFGFYRVWKESYSGKGSDTAVCVTLCLLLASAES